MYWYWWVWWLAIAVLLIALAGGWGYRGWGPPYPRYYYDRRRAGTTVASGTAPAVEPVEVRSGWGCLGDVFWLAVFGAVIWAIVWWFR